MARILEDAQAIVARPATHEGVGDVGQTVLVEAAGDEEAEHDRTGRGDSGRCPRFERGGHTTDRRSDEYADDGEPGNTRGGVERSSGSHGQAREEYHGADETVHRAPNHSEKVGTELRPAQAMRMSGTAAMPPLASPRRRPRSTSGRAFR